MSTKKNAAADAPAQGPVAQPDAKPDAGSPEQQAPTQASDEQPAEPSEREKQLTDELAEVTAQCDGFKTELDVTARERDEAYRELDKMRDELFDVKQELAGFTEPADEQEEEAEAEPEAEPSREDQVKALLTRNGLKKAYILPGDHVCFDEGHAKIVAGADFEALPTITAN